MSVFDRFRRRPQGDDDVEYTLMAADYSIEPVKGESYEGRQWGYSIKSDGVEILHVTTGGTGPCWNIDCKQVTVADDEDNEMHVCELKPVIGALLALLGSEAYRKNVERWK